MTAAILLVAIIAEDPAVMRNAPRDDAAPQATLWRGDWLEVRGETAGFLKVYDHRHERPGFIRPGIVRVQRLDPVAAPELGAVVRFLRDSAGNESLGIGYAALYLRAAPAGSDTSEVFAAIGSMAARLARRGSARRADGRDTVGALGMPAASATTEQIGVAESYGVHFRSIDPLLVGGRARICYDGDAWQRVLATPGAAPLERARAALFFAGDECLDSAMPAADRRAFNDRRVEALGAVDPALLPAHLAGRLRLRRAEALAWRAFDQAKRAETAETAETAAASQAEGAAVRELALTDRGVLAPEDLETYDDVTVRVAASRWATEVPPRDNGKRRATVVVVPRAPGESCVRVVETGTGGGAGTRVLGERCTYGVVWKSALRWSPTGTTATLAVQPLPAWTELWVLHRSDAPAAPITAAGSVSPTAPTASAASWTIEPLVPAATEPEVGYVETAGFSPDGARLLVAREARTGGHIQRRFQVLSLPALTVEKQASTIDKLLAFKRWSAAWWRSGTLALR